MWHLTKSQFILLRHISFKTRLKINTFTTLDNVGHKNEPNYIYQSKSFQKKRATKIIVYFTLREIELQSKLITLLKRPLFLISFCTAAEALALASRSLNEG